jgi:hypothetical protein
LVTSAGMAPPQQLRRRRARSPTTGTLAPR